MAIIFCPGLKDFEILSNLKGHVYFLSVFGHSYVVVHYLFYSSDELPSLGVRCLLTLHLMV
jgi:hypothetical protein